MTSVVDTVSVDFDDIASDNELVEELECVVVSTVECELVSAADGQNERKLSKYFRYHY